MLPRSGPLSSLLTFAALVLLGGCGGDAIPTLTDDSTCEDATAIVDRAVGEARAYLGIENEDVLLADQLVFALSAVDERPECFEPEAIETARGLRGALTAGS